MRIGTDSEGKKYAIKIVEKQNSKVDQKFLELLNAEVTTLQSIKHSNIVNLLDYSDHGKILSSQANTQANEVIYMALELVPNGELFDYVSTTGKFSENMCRLFFLELLEVLNYLHTNNICHRDIKPENIMLDANFHLKLLDFGFSILASGRDGSGLLKTYLGTPLYMAPEIHAGMQYDGRSVDLFAAGVILFILYSGHPPFRAANAYDPLYKQLSSKNLTVFWNFHSKNKPPGFYSSDFKTLINGMLAYDTNERYNMEQLLNHPWCKGTTSTEEDRKNEFSSRFKLVQQKAQKNAEEAKKANTQQAGVYRGKDDDESDDILLDLMDAPMKALYKYDPATMNVLSFMTNKNPNVAIHLIEKAILAQGPASIETDKNKYRITFEIKGAISKVTAKVKICDASKGVYLVDFKKLKVNRLYREIKLISWRCMRN